MVSFWQEVSVIVNTVHVYHFVLLLSIRQLLFPIYWGMCLINDSVLQRIKTSPELVGSWRAHDSSIVSLEFIEHEDGSYIVSASTDQTARLWSTEGHYVGTFGQVSLITVNRALYPWNKYQQYFQDSLYKDISLGIHFKCC